MDSPGIGGNGSILYHILRVIVDGTGSATVFNGPTPLLDAMYTSTSNLITGNDVIMMSLLGLPVT